ncbi:MAG TPA: CBS domain-containing protein [Chitinophagaceae bacterium]|nr:CBS domain-containing protein [Chitinophagaceae bacterium]
MLTRELLSRSIPYLQLSDKIPLALQLMNDNHVTHLPVLDGDKYIGIVSEENLLQIDNDQKELKKIQQCFSNISIKGSEHFLRGLQVAAENNLSVLPVVEDDNEIFGVVTYNDLLKQAAEFMSLSKPGGLIVLEMTGNQYSFTEINKLVESNDAQITQLNTTTDSGTGIMQITIKVNKPEISDIVSTFQRYDYTVKYYFGEELYENELRTNYDNLMNYLKI